MHFAHYHLWTPERSPVRIEFPAGFLNDLNEGNSPEIKRGFLFGVRVGTDVRLVRATGDASAEACRHAATSEPAGEASGKIDCVERIGIFIRRERGEVFLMESDLEWFERQQATIALVIAGGRAGFFVRQADGSIQTVCSHEEFPLAAAGVEAAAADSGSTPASNRPKVRVRKSGEDSARRASPARAVKKPSSAAGSATWARAATNFLAACAVLAGPIAALAYLRPLAAPPARLQLRGDGELAIMSWDLRSTARGGQMVIFDGGEKTVVSLLPDQSSLTYAPQSVAIEVQLTADNGAGQLQEESARLITDGRPRPREPAAESESAGAADRLHSEIAGLEEETNQLRESLVQGTTRIARLQKTIAALIRR